MPYGMADGEIMRAIASYVLAAVLVVSGVELVVPADWIGLPVRARPVIEGGSTLQHVDRTHKSDRLSVPVSVIGKSPSTARDEAPLKPAEILDGCDPVFSPLSTSAQANLPGRCAA